MKSLLKVIFLALIAVSFFSCDTEVNDPNNNNNNNTTEPTGNLEVFIRQDNAAGTYIGGVTVYLYKSAADRDANSVYSSATTPNANITLNGALFQNLTFQKYYLKANYSGSGKNYEGIGESYCPVNTTTAYHLVCTEK
jgi:hypothetical protein